MNDHEANDATVPTASPNWPTLSLVERRILGVLVEKAKTTPDSYPLTLNSLVTGCNQKNNRDPVLSLDDASVENAMAPLKRLDYVQQISGSGRVDKFRHNLYMAWKVDKVELAILGELLLRGAQSLGDLRGRASRMEPIPDLEQLRQQLSGLAQRGLIVYLTPEDRRGAMVTHGFHPPEELAQLKAQSYQGAIADSQRDSVSRSSATAPTGTAPITTLLEQRVQSLEHRLADLEKKIDQISSMVLGG